MVNILEPDSDDLIILRQRLKYYLDISDSPRAAKIIAVWDFEFCKLKKIQPRDP